MYSSSNFQSRRRAPPPFLHLMPYYRRDGWQDGSLPVVEDYYAHCLSLPMYPSLTDEEQDYVIEKVLEFVAGK